MESKVVPFFIRARIDRSKLKCSPSVERTFIYDEIGKNVSTLNYVKSKYDSQLENISVWLSELDKLRFLRHLVNLDRSTRAKKLAAHENKISFLRKKRFGSYDPSSSNVLNYSNYEFTSTELFALKYGFRFSIPPKNISRELVFSEFETLSGQLFHHTPSSTEDIEQLNAKLYDLAHGFCGTPVDLGDFRMRKECYGAFKTLRNNKSIVITKPDKGSGVVVLDRNDYTSKMNDILCDGSKFKSLGPVNEFDFTAKVEKAFQRRMLRLLKDKSITLSTYNEIRPTGSQRPKLYGLPKTHKPNCPLRPILSMIDSPQHKLAKYLTSLLKPVSDRFSKYVVKDSFSFVGLIQNIKPSNTTKLMCSYDIKSLFTNIPLVEVTNICLECLYHSDIPQPPIPEKVFHELLTLATLNVEFSFNDNMYRQVDGVAMGSPLGPILANIFVGYYEEQLFKIMPEPALYRRYVDDIFVLSSGSHEVETLLQNLSNLHPSLAFTKEEEVDRLLPFLDVLVERSNNSFITSIYRKPTFDGQYIPWDSFCPKKRKVNLISCLVHRAIKICSLSKLDNEINIISSIFLNLGYPEFVIKRTIAQTKERANRPTPFGPDKCPVYLRLPFIGNVTARFEKQIRSAVHRTFGSVCLKIVHQTKKPLSAIFKDVSPIHEKNNTIYHFKCHCDSEYIGRTSQRLHQRRDEHVPNNIRKWISGSKRK
ncbi:MAG: reverse transcriptase domain-containing protein, partial [Pseudomonadota bacterium]|nr:reverse transcriptase domain-containing protein [Pseudomonadota bacterium]